MTAKRFMLDDCGELIDLNNHKFINYGEECCKLLNELHEQNQYLTSLKWNQDCINEISVGMQQRQLLEKENEQLKQRNDRQAKQLDRLYHLIEEKDWRTLSDILDDFKRCEEQLQRESGTYW